jgi:NAD(P)-dependent dehydrogenase (short-subunit alcohol dehydrogenase family)
MSERVQSTSGGCHVGGRVEGKIALITGGAQGLGEAASRMLAREGARVAITDVNIKGAQKVAADINQTRKDAAIALSHDVTNEEDWVRVLAETDKAFGGLHILVNNAGIGLTKDLEQITLENGDTCMPSISTVSFLAAAALSR